MLHLWSSFLLVTGFAAPVTAKDNGIVTVPSKHSVKETIDRLESLVKSNGLTVFARLDFSSDAEKSGLKMKPAQLLIFGSPKAGTPLMVDNPLIALDLPLKVLAWEDFDGSVFVSYNNPVYLRARYGISDELLKNISGIKGWSNRF